jgi:hypothetical protein
MRIYVMQVLNFLIEILNLSNDSRKAAAAFLD